ncbi:GTPase [Magnetococcales bacterium HHB-1]
MDLLNLYEKATSQARSLLRGRGILSIILVSFLLLILYFILSLTSLAFSVWDRFQAGPGWVAFIYWSALIGFMGSLALTCWRGIRRFSSGKKRDKEATETPEVLPPPPDEEEVQLRIERNIEAGASVGAAEAELEQLSQRREAGEVHVVLFGEISAGKTALLKVLLPEAEVESSPVGGTTRKLERRTWISQAGDRLVLTDLPGFNEAGNLDESHGKEGKALAFVAREEAARSHAVVYLCDGDLTRDQFAELARLVLLKKPMVLVLNKVDRFSKEERLKVEDKLRERVAELRAEIPIEVVSISSGGQREVVRLLPDGEERHEVRPIPPQIEPLTHALQRIFDQDMALLESLRDSAVFTLAAERLDESLRLRRREQADAMISNHAHKAVLGAMAAFSPGMDLIVQGVLGVAMVRKLCELYDVPVKELELKQLLKRIDLKAIKSIPFLLTVVGNVFKAFPGVGTVAGGVLHAVAYGLIFESLGKSVVRTLESRGKLAVNPTIQLFEECLGDDLENRSRRWLKLAISMARRKKESEQEIMPGAEKDQSGSSIRATDKNRPKPVDFVQPKEDLR